MATRSFLLRGSGFRLAVASRTGSIVHELGPDLLETAERILAAANAVRPLAVSQERAEAARLVSVLRDGVPTSRIRQTWDRLRPFRFRAGHDLRFVVASPIAASIASDNRAESDRLLEDAHQSQLPLVLMDEPEPEETGSPLLTALVADGPTGDTWLGLLGVSHLGGVSGPFHDLTVANHYFQEAVTAWQVATRRHAGGSDHTVVRLDDVDFATWLLTRRDDAQVRDRFDRHFGALVAMPELAETVVTYLASHQDVKRTAEQLFVHTNTVRYRLRKAEELVGGPIASAQVVANLYLAFQDEILARTAR